jgi:peptidoglycan hydrolase CwlO-like protein
LKETNAREFPKTQKIWKIDDLQSDIKILEAEIEMMNNKIEKYIGR